MDKMAQDRMMGALKTGKKPKKIQLDKQDMAEISRLGKKGFIGKERQDMKKVGKS